MEPLQQEQNTKPEPLHKYFVLLDTEVGQYLKCEEDGTLFVVSGTETEINCWDIFPDLTDLEIMTDVLEQLDPKGIKRTKQFRSFIEVLWVTGVLEQLEIECGPNDTPYKVFGVKMKPSTKQHVTVNNI